MKTRIYVVADSNIDAQGNTTNEEILIRTTDLEAAKKEARYFWDRTTDHDKKHSRIEIRWADVENLPSEDEDEDAVFWDEFYRVGYNTEEY